MGHSILLLTATLLTGQIEVIRPVTHHQPAPTSGCVSGSCGATTVGTGCGCECDTGCGNLNFFSRFRTKTHSHSHASHAGCNHCDPCAKPCIFTRLREKFQSLFNRGHGGHGCNTCDTCGQSTGCANGSCGSSAGTIIEGGPVMGSDMKKMPTRAIANEPPLAEPTRGVAVVDQIKPVAFEQPAPANQAKVALLGQYAQRVGHEEDYSWITGQLAQVNGRWVVQYATAETVDRFGGSLPLHTTQDMKNFQAGDLVNVHGNVLHQAGGQGLIYRVNNIHLVEKGR